MEKTLENFNSLLTDSSSFKEDHILININALKKYSPNSYNTEILDVVHGLVRSLKNTLS